MTTAQDQWVEVKRCEKCGKVLLEVAGHGEVIIYKKCKSPCGHLNIIDMSPKQL